MALTASEITDLVNTTLAELGGPKWTDPPGRLNEDRNSRVS